MSIADEKTRTAGEAATRAEIIRRNKADIQVWGGMSRQQSKRYDRDAAKYDAEARRKKNARKTTKRKSARSSSGR